MTLTLPLASAAIFRALNGVSFWGEALESFMTAAGLGYAATREAAMAAFAKSWRREN
jgi:hypothetical protein